MKEAGLIRALQQPRPEGRVNFHSSINNIPRYTVSIHWRFSSVYLCAPLWFVLLFRQQRHGALQDIQDGAGVDA